MLMNANDLESIEDFDADNARHKAVFSFVSSVTGAVQSLHPAGAAAGIVTGPVLTGLEDATGPSTRGPRHANGDAKEADHESDARGDRGRLPRERASGRRQARAA